MGFITHAIRFGTLALAGLGLGAEAAAQALPDLQPGRNFSAAAQFGTFTSENIDAGDVDEDGDLDVGVANGGDNGAQQNRLYINLGGLQGGTLGSFADETAVRFAGVAIDTSRDIEFVDMDADGDVDVFIANRGTLANGGETGRFYTNKGGLQGGTTGFFQEDTNLRWGTLVSVPAGQQILGGNAGPFRDYSCDCDFADLDDDGSMDLFHGSYGPQMDGTRNSLVFLNDGAGVFHEAFPWADAGADIKTHTLDTDLLDLDGDFDIDFTMSSRNSQARVFMNNLYNPISGSMFQDTTQWSLLSNQAGGSANVNYDHEYADVDGDGDFDLWMLNYNGNIDRVMRNDGFTPGAGTQFTQMNAWIKGDPIVDENEGDFIDYDNDGDLDIYIANFVGTNYIYQSGLAEGLDINVSGLFHRTGVALGLAPHHELPAANNGLTTLDGDVADMDNDGDEDILVANNGGQLNFLLTNVLGVPDTHAPTFYRVTAVPASVPGGEAQVIHAQIRDNTSHYNTTRYRTELHWSVNGGPVNVQRMAAQGSMQFRGVLPAQDDGVVTYHIECTDLAGNLGVSATGLYAQGGASLPWTDLGSALAGSAGLPTLTGAGTLLAGDPIALQLQNAKPGALAAFFMTTTSMPIPFNGGLLVAIPVTPDLPVLIPTGSGSIPLNGTLPAGLNGMGLELFFQYVIPDPAAVQGFALSNALKADVP